MKATILILGILAMLLVPVVSQAELLRGEYTATVNGEAYPAKVVLVDDSFFSVGEGWCLLDENGNAFMVGDSFACGEHLWNSEQDVFLYAGQILFTIPGPVVELTPVCDGFSPSPPSCY